MLRIQASAPNFSFSNSENPGIVNPGMLELIWSTPSPSLAHGDGKFHAAEFMVPASYAWLTVCQSLELWWWWKEERERSKIQPASGTPRTHREDRLVPKNTVWIRSLQCRKVPFQGCKLGVRGCQGLRTGFCDLWQGCDSCSGAAPARIWVCDDRESGRGSDEGWRGS